MTATFPTLAIASRVARLLAFSTDEPDDWRLYIAHLVVSAPSLGLPPDLYIQDERNDGRQCATDREGSQCFVHPADGDTGGVVPSVFDAAVTERPGEVPGEQGQADEPADGQDSGGDHMSGWVEGAGEVDIGGDKEMGERQEGRRKQLSIFVNYTDPQQTLPCSIRLTRMKVHGTG